MKLFQRLYDVVNKRFGRVFDIQSLLIQKTLMYEKLNEPANPSYHLQKGEGVLERLVDGEWRPLLFLRRKPTGETVEVYPPKKGS